MHNLLFPMGRKFLASKASDVKGVEHAQGVLFFFPHLDQRCPRSRESYMLKILIACLFAMLALSSCTGTGRTVVHLQKGPNGKLADVLLGTSSGDLKRDRAIANEARRQFSKLVPDPKPYRDYILTVTPPEKARKTDAEDYRTMQKKLKKDAGLRDEVMQMCRKNLGSPADIAELASYTRTSRAEALEVGCKRLTAALANGRLSHPSFEKARQGVKTKELIAILAGR